MVETLLDWAVNQAGAVFAFVIVSWWLSRRLERQDAFLETLLNECWQRVMRSEKERQSAPGKPDD